jgi:hypothetical protein
MKQSSLINIYDGKLLNYFSSPAENCVSRVAIHQKIWSSDDAVGINCFGELLLKSELISYAPNNFSQLIKEDKVLFYSKRLNLYVHKVNWKIFVKFLDDGQELKFGEHIQIRSLQIDDREVLRIF